MIDFSKFNLQELWAIGAVMDDLTSKEVELESWQFACYFRSTAREAFRAESAAIDQQARAAGEAPAAKVQLSSIYGTCAAEEQAPAAADPPAPPDMFGWVGDALDDLCAAGEVMGT